MLTAGKFKRILTIALVVFGSSAAFAADGGLWSVSKSSGEVWIATPGAAQVSLGGEEVLNPGDTIRTGRNGRVLLQRGTETMLIAPNSEVGLPNRAMDGMATTILQRAGSILLDVEKRNVKHFEVETPYLAAVVKGTQFRVTIKAASTKVEVTRGQVEVSDFKTGQIAQVMPGQAATAFAAGRAGLSLSGAGTFNPIEQGSPRASTIQRVPVPRDGLHAPRSATNGASIHALNTVGAPTLPDQHRGMAAAATKANVVRLSTSLGEVNLNVSKASHGLAHGATLPGVRAASGKETVWSDAKASAGSNGNTAAGNANASSMAGDNGSAAAAAAVAAAIGSVNASNSGNGNGNGNGNAATGNGKGNANGNAGGNGGGNGNENGHGKTATATATATARARRVSR